MNGSSFSITGHEAVLCWGYHQAAALGSWKLTATASGGDLAATVVNVDTFRVEQQSLTFRVVRQNGLVVWEWPVVSLHIADGSLSAQVGPQKE